LSNAPVPAPLAAVGLQRFGVLDAARYAVLSYLGQPDWLPSTAPGARSAAVWLQIKLPDHLNAALEALDCRCHFG